MRRSHRRQIGVLLLAMTLIGSCLLLAACGDDEKEKKKEAPPTYAFSQTMNRDTPSIWYAAQKDSEEKLSGESIVRQVYVFDGEEFRMYEGPKDDLWTLSMLTDVGEETLQDWMIEEGRAEEVRGQWKLYMEGDQELVALLPYDPRYDEALVDITLKGDGIKATVSKVPYVGYDAHVGIGTASASMLVSQVPVKGTKLTLDTMKTKGMEEYDEDMRAMKATEVAGSDDQAEEITIEEYTSAGPKVFFVAASDTLLYNATTVDDVYVTLGSTAIRYTYTGIHMKNENDTEIYVRDLEGKSSDDIAEMLETNQMYKRTEGTKAAMFAAYPTDKVVPFYRVRDQYYACYGLLRSPTDGPVNLTSAAIQAAEEKTKEAAEEKAKAEAQGGTTGTTVEEQPQAPAE